MSTTNFYKNCAINVKAISINYCTDEDRYLEMDSHFIQIPQKLYHSFLSLKNKNSPIYVSIRNPNYTDKLLYFGRVEPSIKTNNSTIDMCLLPEWVFERLNISSCDGIIDIVNVIENKDIQQLGYIKIRGNISTYVKWDNIKELIEEKISKFNCINLDDVFYINDVKFTVILLKDRNKKEITFGSTFNTEADLDFDVPDDIAEKIEKEKIEIENNKTEQKRLEKERINNRKTRKFGADIATMKGPITSDDEKVESFTGSSYKLSDYSTSNNGITREERVKLIEKRLKENKNI